MAKYLDYAGLQYLWAKIKNYVSTQPLGANVRYDQQTLTTAQQAQARKNIAAANTNPNLLDNPWFGSGEVVNQRGGTSGTISNAYFIDRWKLSGTYSIAASGITFTCNAGAGVSQIFPHALTIGETYTFSVMYGNGSIVSCTFAPLASRENAYPFGDGLYLEIDTRAAFPTHRCIIYTPGTSWTKEIKAVKLEKGSVSTLANDAPPNYGEELTRCIYSTADPTDTYANNGFGRSNRNLLDNPWFTVRQRGDGPFSGANTFAMDRWRATSNSTITCTTNGITITTTVKKWGMQYRVTKDFFTVGKTYTISALEQDGTITNATFTWTGNGLSLYPTGSNVGFEVSTSNGSYDIIYFTTSEVGSVYLRAVKLELGTTSTLANDAPPDYAEELRKCKYYFKRFSPTAYTVLWSGIAVNATQGAFFVNGEMRSGVNPTIAISGTGYIEQGTSMKLITIGQGYYTRQGTRLILTTSATLTPNTECCVYTSANQNFVVDISAEP